MNTYLILIERPLVWREVHADNVDEALRRSDLKADDARIVHILRALIGDHWIELKRCRSVTWTE